jgi:acyl carrier protein
MVELIIEFEKEFKIAIPDEEEEKISTVAEAVKYIRKNIELRVNLPYIRTALLRG